MTNPKYIPAKRISQFLLFVSALGFFVYYGVQNWNEVRAVARQIDPGLIFIAMVFVTLSLFCKALMNLGMLRELLHTPLDNLTFSRRIASAGLTEVLTAPASPWQNAYAGTAVACTMNTTGRPLRMSL